MTNPTSNFGWQMPTPTDLVTDLPADFEVFGQAVDTSMADLKGGTTGQILSKATNADMDFTWITNDVGDITAVTVSSPLTGGGTSGSVSVGILSGTTSNLGAVQLSDSTSSTSTTLAATANAVKTSYDLAAAAVPKSTVTTAGDVIYATGSSAVTRLGIGTAGQVLTVNGGATAPAWTTLTSTAGLTKITNQSFSASSAVNVNNCFSATYKNYRVLIKVIAAAGVPDLAIRQRIAGTDTVVNYYYAGRSESWNNATTLNFGKNVSSYIANTVGNANQTTYSLDFHLPYSGVFQITGSGVCPDAGVTFTTGAACLAGGTVDGFSLIPSSSTITGEVTIYGYTN
jgi:hypothetical protein